MPTDSGFPQSHAEVMRQQERIVAEIIRAAGAYRWVGIYEVDHGQQRVVNLAWSGPGAPAHPEFPLSDGLTGRAVAERRTVSVGDVSRDGSYLLAFPDTRSEVIVPIFASDATTVIGTIDVESDRENAFDRAAEAFLERCAGAIRSLWESGDVGTQWEWSGDQIRRVGYRVVDLIARHLTELPEGGVFRPFPTELAEKFAATPPPSAGAEPDAILDEFAANILPYPFGNGHPRFYGWVNSPPAVMGIFAEALAAAMNPSCAGGNHAAVYVERQVIRWLETLVGFPAGGIGLLVSGGSMAALTALAVARHLKADGDVRRNGLRGLRRPLVFYKSAEGHGCHQKAIELMGIGAENLRIIAHDAALTMVPSALDEAIRGDLAEGRVPVAVIATAGTVNTGAIDPLGELADVCARHGVWLHVDAAYGGPAILAGDHSARLAAIARADSIALDPHKWLYVPVEAGAVLVRDAKAMRAAFSLVPPYLQTDGNVSGIGGPPWFSEYGFQQTRAFRALKVWMALKHHGLDGYRNAIERDIALARFLADRLTESGEFQVWRPQSLSIVCFRYAPRAIRDGARLDAINRAALERVQLGGKAFLSSTQLDGRFWLRACIVNPRASRDDIDILIAAVRAAAEEETCVR